MNGMVDIRAPLVNAIGASWFEDLSPGFLDECLSLEVAVVGCTANDTWDDTLESIENLQAVKQVVADHGKAYIIASKAALDQGRRDGKIGVLLGFQNPKPMSDSLSLLEAFIDMGLRCCGLAFRENSYYGCGFSSKTDSGLTDIGRAAVGIMNRRGVVIDLSHVGDQTALDAVALSEHPVIFTHSMARTLMARKGQVNWAGVTNSSTRRAAPDELIIAAAAKGGVICPDSRMAGTMASFMENIDHMVQLVGVDHVGIAAQDDWHRSQKDARRIQPYLPGYDSVAGNKARDFGTDYRIYRMEDQLGPKIIRRELLTAELRARNYSDEDITKICGGNLLRVLAQVLPA